MLLLRCGTDSVTSRPKDDGVDVDERRVNASVEEVICPSSFKTEYSRGRSNQISFHFTASHYNRILDCTIATNALSAPQPGLSKRKGLERISTEPCLSIHAGLLSYLLCMTASSSLAPVLHVPACLSTCIDQPFLPPSYSPSSALRQCLRSTSISRSQSERA